MRASSGSAGGKRRTRSGSGRPSYARLVEWKKILRRLSDFLRLIDCQLLDLFHRLVRTGVRDLLHLLDTSFEVGVELVSPAEVAKR